MVAGTTERRKTVEAERTAPTCSIQTATTSKLSFEKGLECKAARPVGDRENVQPGLCLGLRAGVAKRAHALACGKMSFFGSFICTAQKPCFIAAHANQTMPLFWV